MSYDLRVVFECRDRHEIIRNIESWCLENKITAYADPSRFMTETTPTSKGNYTTTTTYWKIPDEKEKMLFMLKWCR